MSDERNGVAAAVMARWFRDPVAFVRQVCGAEPEPWQLDVLAAAATSQQVALVGSKGTGKTTVLAWLLLWFLFTRPHANIAATSISGDNLRDGLWKECAKWIHASRLLAAAVEWNQQSIVQRTFPATWWARARQWSKSADTQQQSDTLAGLHADYTMFLIDEAGGVPMAIAVTAQAALASGRECKLVIGGNPTHTTGPLYSAAVTHRAHWATFRINGDPKNPRRSSRVDLEWAKQQIQQHGRDNPWVQVNVLGEFPAASINALLGVEEVEAAMRRKVRADAYDWSQKRLGVDVARFGDDRSVIFPRQGLASFLPIVVRHQRTTDIAARVARAIGDWRAELVLVDDTGHWGHGVIDNLMAAGYDALPVVFSDPALEPRYRNRRAECWLLMAEWVKKGGMLPNVPELVAELAEPTYTFVGGKFLLEEKDQVKKRLGRSPDLADALALTFAMPEMPAAMSRLRQQSIGKVLTDFNPFPERR